MACHIQATSNILADDDTLGRRCKEIFGNLPGVNITIGDQVQCCSLQEPLHCSKPPSSTCDRFHVTGCALFFEQTAMHR